MQRLCNWSRGQRMCRCWPTALPTPSAWASLQQAQGRSDQALATLDAFMQLAQQRHVAPMLLAQCAALRVQLELARGDLPAAQHWAATSGLSANDVLGYLREREYLTLV